MSVCSSSSSLSYREDESLAVTIAEQDNQNIKFTRKGIKITNNLENRPGKKKLKAHRDGKKPYRQHSLPIISKNNLDSTESTEDSSKITEDLSKITEDSSKLTGKSIDNDKSLLETSDWAEEDDQPVQEGNLDFLEKGFEAIRPLENNNNSIKKREKKKRRFCVIF